MRRTFLVPSLALVVMSGAWVACSSSSSTTPADTADASTAPDTSTPYDAALPPDDADVAETAPPPVRAKVTFVNASPGLFPVRLCLGVETPPVLISLLYPLPNEVALQGAAPFLGVFPGTAMVFPNLTDLAAFDVTLYAVNAQLIASDTSAGAESDCPTLLGPSGMGADGGTLVPNVDFVRLPTIPQGTFTHGSSFVVVLEGCNADPQGTLGYSTALCGGNWVAGAGNVTAQVFQVDDTNPATTALGLQVIHASSAWDGLTDAGGQAIANTFGVYDDANDAGALPPIAQRLTFGSMAPPDAAAPQTVVAADYASSGLYTLVTAADGGPLAWSDGDGGTTLGFLGPYPFSFAQIQAVSGYATGADGGVMGPLYLPGSNFTAVWVGDPRQPAYVGADGGALSADAGGTFNAAAPHFLLLRNDPVVPAP
jgi:hypothetical protein